MPGCGRMRGIPSCFCCQEDVVNLAFHKFPIVFYKHQQRLASQLFLQHRCTLMTSELPSQFMVMVPSSTDAVIIDESQTTRTPRELSVAAALFVRVGSGKRFRRKGSRLFVLISRSCP